MRFLFSPVAFETTKASIAVYIVFEEQVSQAEINPMSIITVNSLYNEYLENRKTFLDQNTDEPVSEKTVSLSNSGASLVDYDDDSIFLSDTSSIVEELEHADIATEKDNTTTPSPNTLGLETPYKTSVNDIYTKLIHLLNKGNKGQECVKLIEDNHERLDRKVISDIIKDSNVNIAIESLLKKYIFDDNDSNTSIKRYLSNYPYENKNIIYREKVSEEEPVKPKEDDDDDVDWGWDEDLDIDNIETSSPIVLPIPFIELLKIEDCTKNTNPLIFKILLENIGYNNVDALIYIEKYIGSSNTFLHSLIDYSLSNFINSTIKSMLLGISDIDENKDIIKIISYNIDSALLLKPLLENISVDYNKEYLLKYMNVLLTQIDNTAVSISMENYFLIKNHLSDCFKKLGCYREKELLDLLKQL